MREPYIPLFTSVVRSSLWSLDGDTIKVFLTICAEADPEGYCSASIDGIRRIADLSLDDTKKAIVSLSTPDLESKDLARGGDGRRIEVVPNGYRVVNLPWYRELARKEAERARKREWWTKKGSAARRAARPTETETETETESLKRETAAEPVPAPPSAPLTFSRIPADYQITKDLMDRAWPEGTTEEALRNALDYWRSQLLPPNTVDIDQFLLVKARNPVSRRKRDQPEQPKKLPGATGADARKILEEFE